MLNAGTKLGPYEIVAPVGAGGMGEVYRARDTRLNRGVAIKVLPTELAKDAGRLARFEQEAKATAALNHPNIVVVFDVGVEGSQPYVVSELLEGETLREALSGGALPQRKAMDIAIQTAQGLAAAHQKGIVHRDLKPENVFLTTEGRAKILDFGLAKLAGEAADARAGASIAATMRPETTPGMVLGTVGYMSPEQVRGEPADHRTDIFAFGAVFYEMLSGQRAFKRDTAAETMTAILKEDPPELASGVRPMSPAFDRIIRRCLEKNPLQRFQSASDIAFALDALWGSSGSTSVAALAPKRSWWRPAAIGAAIAVAFALGVAVARQPGTKAPGVVTFVAKTFDLQPIMNARFMPDGQTIVYSAVPHGYTPDLFVIRPDSEAPQPLGVSKAQLLSVSSKGELAIITNAQYIGQRLFSGTLAKMTLGSAPRPMLEHVREADWSPDGSSLAIVRDLGNGRDRLEYPVGTALHEVSGYGVVLRKTDGSPGVRLGEGNPQKLSPDGKWASAIIATPPQLVIYPTGPGEPVRFNRGAIERYRTAEWFPDSRRLLACGSEPSRAPRCYVQDVAGSPPKPVTPEGVLGTLAPDGRTLLLTMTDGMFQLSSIDGGAVQQVVGLRAEDIVVAWSRDSRSLFVQRGLEVPTIVERVELTTGRRTVVRHVAPEGSGLGSVGYVTVGGWADEGRWYAYSYWSNPATLFVVSGALRR